jgi:hypothetical protein
VTSPTPPFLHFPTISQNTNGKRKANRLFMMMCGTKEQETKILGVIIFDSLVLPNIKTEPFGEKNRNQTPDKMKHSKQHCEKA